MIPKSVLLCDDNRIVRQALSCGIDAMGAHVTDFESADAAIESLGKEVAHFDVIVTDQEMPGTSGTEFASIVRRLNPWVPIVIISGTLISVSDGEEDGIHFLAKPFSLKHLFEKFSPMEASAVPVRSVR